LEWIWRYIITQLQFGNPVWLSEIGLGIGRERGIYQGMTREWLYWYDEQGKRILTPEEQIAQEKQRATEAEQVAQQERQRAKLLEERLRSLGVDPDYL
jgi:hypothetical protein